MNSMCAFVKGLKIYHPKKLDGNVKFQSNGTQA